MKINRHFQIKQLNCLFFPFMHKWSIQMTWLFIIFIEPNETLNHNSHFVWILNVEYYFVSYDVSMYFVRIAFSICKFAAFSWSAQNWFNGFSREFVSHQNFFEVNYRDLLIAWLFMNAIISHKQFQAIKRTCHLNGHWFGSGVMQQ